MNELLLNIKTNKVRKVVHIASGYKYGMITDNENRHNSQCSDYE